MTAAFVCQILLLAYHQGTTFFDLFPFNGARFYARSERWAEMGSNAVLMGLAPLGFALDFVPLKVYGAYYYFVLFGIELVIWWIPYCFVPSGWWRRIYNALLALATFDLSGGDALDRWLAVHQRLHGATVTVLPRRPNRINPNLEHTLLHLLTLVTAVVTWRAVYA
jgi:hypothetical protein